MLTNKNALELSSIARHGASLVVDGSQFSALELSSVAQHIGSGARLTVFNANRFSTLELTSIAKNGPSGGVEFA